MRQYVATVVQAVRSKGQGPLSALFMASLTLAAGVLASACASEDYYCDATGCYYCDGIGCRLLEPPARPQCRGDFECASGLSCTTLGCVLRCEMDAQCPQGAVCRQNQCLGPTEPAPTPRPGTCQRNLDCGSAELVCRDGLCARDDLSCGEAGCACSPTHLCSAGLVCTDGECRAPDQSCQFNYQCAGGTCVDGRCITGCGAGMTCAAGLMCEGNACREAPRPVGQCQRNDQCSGANKVCLDSSCYDACSSVTACATGFYCNNGVCRVDDRPKPFCTTDTQCRAGHPCVDGICRTPCTSDNECAMFDVQFRVCREGFCRTTNEATSNCRTSVGCTDGRECTDGVCVSPR